MPLTREDVLTLATLARVRLSDEEVTRAQADLATVVAAFDALRAIPTDGVAPLTHPLAATQALRDDTALPSLPVDIALAAAPARHGDLIAVPAAIGDDA